MIISFRFMYFFRVSMLGSGRYVFIKIEWVI